MEEFHQILGSSPSTITWWQMSARGAVVLIYAIVLLRLAARRVHGRDTAMDIIVAVIVGSALSRAMTGTADLLPTLGATAVLFALHSLIAAIAVRSNWFSKLVKGRATQLIKDGKLDERQARRSLLGKHDIEQELRLHGVTDPASIQAAWLERNGRISVIKRPRA